MRNDPDPFGWDDPPNPLDRPYEMWRAGLLLVLAVIVVAVTPIDASGWWRLGTWILLLGSVADFARIVSRRY